MAFFVSDHTDCNYSRLPLLSLLAFFGTNWYRPRWAKLVQPLLENGSQHRQLAGATWDHKGPPGASGPSGKEFRVPLCISRYWYQDLRNDIHLFAKIKSKTDLTNFNEESSANEKNITRYFPRLMF